MSLPQLKPATKPLLTYQSTLRALSRRRIEAYSIDTDTDSDDAIARYLWNMELAAAVWPILHLLEVTFRNTLFEVGQRTTKHRVLQYQHNIQCWLDATDAGKPLLQLGEQKAIAEALVRLGKNPRRQSPGHLVSYLGFGFWVNLCNSPYEQGRREGPQLWPEAIHRFPGCPKAMRNRGDIRAAFDDVREFRNDIAHHQPIWDKDPVRRSARMVELLGWMNPQLANAAAHCALVESVFQRGFVPLRPLAASLLCVVLDGQGEA